MIHIPMALAMQLFFGNVFHDWWLGAAFGSAFFIGREITQAEYRWIEAYGSGLRANMPWWGAFDRRVWNAKSLVDFVAPAAACAALAWKM
jgi:hypothetical protein